MIRRDNSWQFHQREALDEIEANVSPFDPPVCVEQVTRSQGHEVTGLKPILSTGSTNTCEYNLRCFLAQTALFLEGCTRNRHTHLQNHCPNEASQRITPVLHVSERILQCSGFAAVCALLLAIHPFLAGSRTGLLHLLAVCCCFKQLRLHVLGHVVILLCPWSGGFFCQKGVVASTGS